ncbi:MAG: TRAP transporter substrate-binding protein DctP, partial [Rhizobiales bacterium]|nr:TRAP transporter substrate-binding protein DctP [Hyphomicrobiales bacterium]
MNWISRIAAGLMALSFATVMANAAEINWDMANEYNDTSIHAEGDKVFAKALEENSGGKIKITHHFGGSIGFKSKDQLDAVGDGALPIADTYVGPLGGINPMFLLPSLPFQAAT